jgi:poly(3-hydroxyalkanoate) depolymerase
VSGRPVPASQQTVRSVSVDGQQLRVAERRGQPGRVPLLVINGIGASLELLQPFVDALDPALGVIRFDVPGIGGSPAPAAPYRFTGLCRVIARMLAVLGHDSVDVLGISWGGGVAQHFAAFQRARCRRLVLVSTATGAIMVPAGPGVLLRLATPRRYLDPGYLERIAPGLYGGSARTDPARVSAAMHANNRVGPDRGYLYQLTAGLGWTSLPFLPLLRQQTLIMSGDDDPIIPLANGYLMRRLIPHSRLHVYHGGHLGLVTEAAQLAPVVDGFLAAGPADAAAPGVLPATPGGLPAAPGGLPAAPGGLPAAPQAGARVHRDGQLRDRHAARAAGLRRGLAAAGRRAAARVARHRAGPARLRGQPPGRGWPRRQRARGAGRA